VDWLRLQVTGMSPVAHSVLALTLSATDGTTLPSWQPGTHIDFHFRDDHVRQSSLCGAPHDWDSQAVERLTAGWPEGALHVKCFTPSARAEIDSLGSASEVLCARSGKTAPAGPGVSVLRTLRDAGLDGECACEQGVCGTCETKVLSGELDHQNSILTTTETSAGAQMMICVARARLQTLILDV